MSASIAATDRIDPDGISLEVEGTWNDRDAASLTGVHPGVLLRSAALAGLDDAGRSRLRDLGVSDVIDLRSDGEAASQGFDAVPADVTVHRLPITPGGALAGQVAGGDPAAMERFAALISTPGWAHDLMVGIYREIVTSPEAVAQLGHGLRVIAQAEGAVVVHCSAGKDRTGVLVALAALLAGADRGAVEEDFLYSNHAAGAQRAVVPPIPGVDPSAFAPLLGVHLESLRGALAAIEAEHGSLEAFADAAGVDAPTLDRLVSRLRPPA